MKAKLACVSLVGLALASVHAFAVELGEPRVESNLGEPLRALVPLTDSDGVDPRQLQAAIAGDSAFLQAAFIRKAVVDDIKVKVVAHDSQPGLRLSSERSVRDPFLDIVLDLEWPGGQKQYPITMLFDPPGYAEKPPLIVPVLVKPATVQPVAVKAAAEPPVNDKPLDRVKIGQGDTLWSLAKRLRPGPDVAIQQMVVALVEANPAVFPDGNINRIRSGQYLMVPSREMIEKRTSVEAKRQFQSSDPAQWVDNAPEPATDSETAPAAEDTALPLASASEDAAQDASTGSADPDRADALQASTESTAEAAKTVEKVEVPPLVDDRLMALALEKQRQADQRDLEALRNQKQSLQRQVAQQQQELIALQKQLDTANAQAQEMALSEQPAATAWWQQWGNQGLMLGAAALALLLGGVALRKRYRSENEDVRTNEEGAEVAFSAHQQDNAPIVTSSPSSAFELDKHDA